MTEKLIGDVETFEKKDTGTKSEDGHWITTHEGKHIFIPNKRGSGINVFGRRLEAYQLRRQAAVVELQRHHQNLLRQGKVPYSKGYNKEIINRSNQLKEKWGLEEPPHQYEEFGTYVSTHQKDKSTVKKELSETSLAGQYHARTVDSGPVNMESNHMSTGDCISIKFRDYIRTMSREEAMKKAVQDCAKRTIKVVKKDTVLTDEDIQDADVFISGGDVEKGVKETMGRWITYAGKHIFIRTSKGTPSEREKRRAAFEDEYNNYVQAEYEKLKQNKGAYKMGGKESVRVFNSKNKQKLEELKQKHNAGVKSDRQTVVHRVKKDLQDSVEPYIIKNLAPDELDDYNEMELDELEKGITLTHKDLNTLITDLTPLCLHTGVTFGRYKNTNRVDLELFENDGNDRVASFTFFVEDPKMITPEQMGWFECLTAARLASELVRPVIMNNSYPFHPDLGELLSKYAGVTVRFQGDICKPGSLNIKSTIPTILLSGGVDSTSLLASQKGNANALTFIHGQSFSHGKWNEKNASQAVFEIAKSLGDYDTRLIYAKHRFRVYKYPKVWAKSFRNLFFAAHGALIYPNQQLWLGAHFDDLEHDCNAELVDEFRKMTSIPIYAPVIYDSRANIIKRMQEFSNDLHPYLYGSTFSCQMVRFVGNKHVFCGSCHSCLLRLPAIQLSMDPRFRNFDNTFEAIPEQLNMPIHRVWAKKNYMWGAHDRWWNRLNEQQQDNFRKDVEFVKNLETSKNVYISNPPKQQLPKDFIVRFIGGMSHRMVKDLNIYDLSDIETVFIPFTGSSRSVYKFAKQGKKVICSDIQPFVTGLVSTLQGRGNVNLELDNIQPVEGWLYENRHFRATDDIARFIDGYVVKYMDNPFAKAVLGLAMTNATFRGYLGNFDVDTVDEFKELIKSAQKRLIQYFGSCPDVVYREESYTDVPVKKADLVFVDPPKIVSSGTDVYSQQYNSLNSVLVQDQLELQTWTAENYLKNFDCLKDIDAKRWLFIYTTDVTPGLPEVTDYLASLGEMRCVNNYIVGSRCDYLFEVVRDTEVMKDIKGKIAAEALGTKKDLEADLEKKVYRFPGESMKECVSRKIAINIKEGKPRDQAVAVAFSECGQVKKEVES